MGLSPAVAMQAGAVFRVPWAQLRRSEAAVQHACTRWHDRSSSGGCRTTGGSRLPTGIAEPVGQQQQQQPLTSCSTQRLITH